MMDEQSGCSPLVVHFGGCHCKSIRFKVEAPAKVKVWDCNCSICKMRGNKHFVVPASQFELLSGKKNLTLYQFGTRTAKHLFCKTCGISSYYVPRSNPDGFSITVACLDPGTLEHFELVPCDGEHWEEFFAKTDENIATKV